MGNSVYAKTRVGISMNGKKDRMAEALEQFWGTGKAAEVQIAPQQMEQRQDILTPQEASSEYQAEGDEIRQKVEASINATQDLTPDARAAVRYMGSQSAQQQRNPFDLGGFDEMIQKQLARERGFGMSGIGMGIAVQKPMSYEEKQNRAVAEIKLKALKENTALAKQERSLLLRSYAQQQRNLRNVEAQTARSYREGAQAVRFNAGLPVYESPLDVLAGGKRKVKTYNSATKQYDESIERYGGLFGAAGEVYGGYKAAAPHVAGVLTKGGNAFLGAGKATGEAFMKVGSYYDKSEIKNRIDKLFNDEGSSGRKMESSSNKFVTRNPKEEITMPKQESILSAYERIDSGSTASDINNANRLVNNALGERNIKNISYRPSMFKETKEKPIEEKHPYEDKHIEQILSAPPGKKNFSASEEIGVKSIKKKK
jgi:hypothetical protein